MGDLEVVGVFISHLYGAGVVFGAARLGHLDGLATLPARMAWKIGRGDDRIRSVPKPAEKSKARGRF